ncbi:MAG: hypothetical protein ACI39H_00390 [Lachnospiraceae bacterium]
MAKRILWEEPEALLLFDAYELIQNSPDKRKLIVSALSINLRRRAKDLKISIDDVFRNQAGINMRLLEIEKILHPESSGLSNTSALFRSIADMYINHRRTFLRKVREMEEYRIRILADQVRFDKYEAAVLLEGYLGLVIPGETKAHTARVVSAKLQAMAVNRGCVINDTFRNESGIIGRLNKMDQVFRGNPSGDDSLPQVFVDVVYLYRNNRDDYKRILEDANKLIGKVILPEDIQKAVREKQRQRDAAPVKKSRYVRNKRDRKLKDIYPKLYVAVFDALEKRFYTDPQGVTATEIFSDLKKKFPRKMIIEILEGSSWAKEKTKGKYVHALGDEIMAEQEAVEKKFFKWLRAQLSEKQATSIEKNYKMISLMLLQQRIIKKPLLLIDNLETLLNVKDKVPGCFVKNTVRRDAIQLVDYYITYLEKTVVKKTKAQTANIKVANQEPVSNELQACDASQTGFYNWLSQYELLAGPTCRSYVSGIRSSEAYAKTHGYVDYMLFSDDSQSAAKIVVKLLEDDNFIAQHASYRAHLKKYLQYLGGEAPVSLNTPIKPKLEKKEKPSENIKLIQAIEDTVKGYPEGISAIELEDRFSKYSDSERRAALQAADVIPVLDKYYHKDTIEDFDFLVDTLYDALRHQFNADGGYTSAHALYKEVHPKLDDFFFYNGAFESRAEIYDLASYMFGKASYKDAQFIFYRKQHIWQEAPDYAMDYSGLMIKYAREHGNVISRDEAIEYVSVHGSGTPAQTVSLILNKSGWNLFLQYAENQFVLAEALNIDENFLEAVKAQIEALLGGDDYVALGDVSDYFYSTLPTLPAGVTWGPLLLESILERYEVGFITIDAGDYNDMKTIDAALLRKTSVFKTFADIVWNELKHDFELPHTFTNEEFRLYLLGKGFLHGLEKINTVHKTVANDLRFYWTDGNNKVTVSNA